MRLSTVVLILPVVLTGCQSLPDYSWSRQPTSRPMAKPIKPIVFVEPTVKPSPEVKAPPAKTNTDDLKLPDTPTPIRPTPPVVAQPQRKLADGRDMPAVQSLLASASASMSQGRPEDAANSLERAQRLAPQSATVYQRLAEVRLQQNRFAEAEQLARKGLAYAQGNAQQAVLWRLVAIAADKQGKIDTANHARDKVLQLEAAGDRG